MAAGPTTPEDLHAQVGAKLDEHHHDIQNAITKTADKLNTISDWSWLAGPVAGVGVGKLVENFRTMCSKIWEAFTTVCARIWEIVGDAAGRPVDLNQLAQQYQALRAAVGPMANDIQLQSGALERVWSGLAAGAYVDVANLQTAALGGVGQALDSAASLLAGAAESILLMWSNMLDQAVQGWLGAASALTDLGDLGNIAGAEVGPIVNAVLALGGAVWGATKTYIDYISNQATTVANGWNSINGGVDGLPSFAWPAIAGSTADQYNSGDWHTAAGG